LIGNIIGIHGLGIMANVKTDYYELWVTSFKILASLLFSACFVFIFFGSSSLIKMEGNSIISDDDKSENDKKEKDEMSSLLNRNERSNFNDSDEAGKMDIELNPIIESNVRNRYSTFT
jgi:hypothetical protein